MQNFYISYILNKTNFGELLSLIYELKKSNDPDVVREAEIINQKLIKEIFRILQK